MPSTSQAQSRFMHAIADNPELAKEKGVPQEVGRDFVKADTGRKIENLPERAPRKRKAKKRGSIPGLSKKGR